MLAANLKKVEVLKEVASLQLFFIPLAGLEPDAVKYIQLRRAKVLQSMESSMAPKVTTVDSQEGLENEI